MRFCVDECSFRLVEEQRALLTRLAEDFVELFQACRESGDEDIGVWSDIYWVEVLPGITLTNLLYEAPFADMLDETVRKALMEAVQRCVFWNESQPAPEVLSVEVLGATLEAPTLAFAHAQAGEKKAVAALGLASSERQGRLEVLREGTSRRIHCVTGDPEKMAYLRDVPEIEDMSPEQYMSHAPIAFPTIHFTEGLAQQFKRFSQAYQHIRPRVTEHLAALGDHFQTIMRQYKGDTNKVMANFRTLCGIDASPESSNTHGNSSAMAAHKVPIGGQNVLCEWHTKIEGHRDRIYFHPGSPNVANGRLVVGIFHEHL